ncbi:methyltransferase-like protein 9 isoform X1 [Pomacea canaliculata]|uniref:methyltransferase-like protein 9 isoform X1 n=1 Tax=Pomacea canaliculata TaxID=400727 RepID=UPI000D73949D|nr:methyltransferase-like protein 9 isoform X1 [Pomacea canaliculata]
MLVWTIFSINTFLSSSLLISCAEVEVMGEFQGIYLRTPLARAVYNRLREDNIHRNSKHEYWYNIDSKKLPEDLCQRFVQFQQDEETTQFLRHCEEKADSIFTQIFQSIARSVLSWFMSKTSVNGWIGCGSMFVISRQQFESLLGLSPVRKAENLLDIGAGDGEVTKVLVPYFSNIYVTEMSPPMVAVLSSKGYHVLDVSGWSDGNITYDVISCLNVLDRCDKPVSMLQSIRKALRQGSGRAVVAVVIPFKPYVEFNSVDHIPTEHLQIAGGSFEEQVTSLVQSVFQPAGFEVEAFTRLPYLCEGDLNHSFYVLHDAVFVLRSSDGSKN